MKKIAILIPAYNSQDPIVETLESIQKQEEYLNKIQAVYIADDCSQDDTISIAQKCWLSSVHLEIIKSEKNQGERRNVNGAIATFKNKIDWVLILHSDDIAKSNWLELMISRIENCDEKVGSICSSYDNLMTDGTIVVGEDNLSRNIEVIAGNIESVKGTFKNGCWWHLSGCAIRIKTFENIGGFMPEMPQKGDWEWLLRCLNQGYSIEYIPRTLILYRQHYASVSSISFNTHRDITESIEIVDQYKEILTKEEILNLYQQWIIALIKRIGRSLLQRNIKRLWLAIKIIVIIMKNYVNVVL